MADATTPLTAQDIANFIATKKIDMTCPECKGTSTGYEDEGSYSVRFSDVTFPFPDRDVSKMGGVDKVMLVCQECGYIRSYLREVVLKVIGG